MTDLTTLDDADLDAMLSYQLCSGRWTWADCSNGCGRYSRSGRVCDYCLRAEIERRDRERDSNTKARTK